MNQPKSVLSLFIWIVLFGANCTATATSVTPEQNSSANASYGRIHFNNDKGEEKCVLPIPEETLTADFSRPDEYCEDNMVSTFWLENLPSATTIGLYENGSCAKLQTSTNFYFVLKTVKQPTDWTGPGGPVVYSIDALRNASPGELLPKKNTRVDEAFVGSTFDNKNLNERLSCVHIVRSPPVN